MRNLLERETWDRLPLPDSFQIKEIADPLGDFPENYKEMLKLFENNSI